MQAPYAQNADIYDDGTYKKKQKPSNHLLVRTAVGQIKATTYDLPPQEHTYGRPDIPDAEGAGVVIRSWQTHQQTRGGTSSRDFVALNARAAASCTNARDMTQFRKTNDVRQPAKRSVRGDGDANWPATNSEVTYGRRNIPDGNFHTLIGNQYQRDWVEKQRYKSETKKAKTRNFIPPTHTRASLGQTRVPDPEPKKLTKLKQFRNVPSRHLEVKGSYTQGDEAIKKSAQERARLGV